MRSELCERSPARAGKKLLICVTLVSGFLGLFTTGCSPYELNDPTCAKVTIIEEQKAPDKKQVVQEQVAKPAVVQSSQSAPAVVQSSQSASDSTAVLNCWNCGHEIKKNEGSFVFEGRIVCSDCYTKLKNQK